jgi:parvulin-like peptidyl-prolyl isomerase
MGYAILRLDEIQPADEEKFKEEKEKFKEQALQRKKMETYQTWITKLKEKARIESNLKPPAEESS